MYKATTLAIVAALSAAFAQTRPHSTGDETPTTSPAVPEAPEPLVTPWAYAAAADCLAAAPDNLAGLFGPPDFNCATTNAAAQVYLYLHGFNAAVPPGAEIVGAAIMVRWGVSNPGPLAAAEFRISLHKAPPCAGPPSLLRGVKVINYAIDDTPACRPFRMPTARAGTSGDLWGYGDINSNGMPDGITPAEANDPAFGMLLGISISNAQSGAILHANAAAIRFWYMPPPAAP